MDRADFSDLDAILTGAREMSEEEEAFRRRCIAVLFGLYGEKAGSDRAEAYLLGTADIPAFFLASAIRVVRENRVWASLPTVGDLFAAAKRVANMDRPIYSAGHALPPPKAWPPARKRYQENQDCGRYESVTHLEQTLLPEQPSTRLVGAGKPEAPDVR